MIDYKPLAGYLSNTHIIKVNCIMVIYFVFVKQYTAWSWKEPHLMNIALNIPPNIEGHWVAKYYKYFPEKL